MTIETIGAYFLGRSLLANTKEIGRIITTYVGLVFFITPFAIYEALTGANIYLDIISNITFTFSDVPKPTRLGLDRVQAGFEHPILFGIAIFSLMSATYYLYSFNGQKIRGFIYASTAFLVGSLCLSSGPIVAGGIQIVVLTFDTVFSKNPRRFKVLFFTLIPLVVFFEIVSNRSLYQVGLQLISFNAQTAYNRVLIFYYGTQSVLNNPVFGIGWNDWERPSWMPPSMDMFWLIWFVRHGVISGISILSCTIYVFWKLLTTASDSGNLDMVKVGFGISILGYFAAGWTVHFWNATFVLLIFMIGIGVSLLEADNSVEPHSKRPKRTIKHVLG